MPKRASFLFDYASPFSYVASVLIERGALGEVDYEPVYLRGLESFSKTIPFSAAKLTYLMNDLARVCAHHQIPLRPPATFPVNGLYALRGALAALGAGRFAEYHRRAFSAVWAEGRDLSTAESVIDLGSTIGLGREELGAKMADPAIKDDLRRRTELAVERGVFGVPAFFVGDELFWGHDRMDYVGRALVQGA